MGEAARSLNHGSHLDSNHATTRHFIPRFVHCCSAYTCSRLVHGNSSEKKIKTLRWFQELNCITITDENENSATLPVNQYQINVWYHQVST